MSRNGPFKNNIHRVGIRRDSNSWPLVFLVSSLTPRQGPNPIVKISSVTFRYKYLFFVYYHPFLKALINIGHNVTIDGINADGVLGIWTRDHRMVGTDKSNETWRPLLIFYILGAEISVARSSARPRVSIEAKVSAYKRSLMSWRRQLKVISWIKKFTKLLKVKSPFGRW